MEEAYKRSRFFHFCYDNGVMDAELPRTFYPPTNDPISLFIEWCGEQKASHSQTQRIVALLSLEYMLSLLLSPRTARSIGIADFIWHRFLFRRHLQNILRWTTRRPEGASDGFSEKLNWLIRCVFFPDPSKFVHDGEIVAASMARSSDQGQGSVAKNAVHGGKRPDGGLRQRRRLTRRATLICNNRIRRRH